MSLILHLSDLHLGPVEGDVALGDYKSEIVSLTERTLQKLNDHLKQKTEHLDAIVITGDITVKGHEEGFKKLEELLACLNDVRPPANQIVVVPGNHDVAWAPPDEPAVRYQQFLTYVWNKGYTTPLLEGIDLNGTKPSRYALKSHFLLGPTGEWAILPINSANYCGKLEPIGSISEDNWEKIPSTLVGAGMDLIEAEVQDTLKKLRLHDIARISKHQFSAIEWLAAEIRASIDGGKPKPLVIAVLHHHLLPVSDAEEFKSYESITNLGHLRHVLRRNDISVVLHGHKHIEYAYYDHIYEFPEAHFDKVFRTLVIAGATVGAQTFAQNQVCRLVEIAGSHLAPTVAVTQVPATSPGIPLQLSQTKVFPVWQRSGSPTLAGSAVNVIEGGTVEEAYDRLMAVFSASPSKDSGVFNLVCRVDRAMHPVRMPAFYPPIPGVDADKRAQWFTERVEWWQKQEFKRLRREHCLNHGNRIYSYDVSVNQLESVIEILKAKPKSSRAVVTLIKPHFGDLKAEAKFPCFCFVHFAIREDRNQLALELIAYFRKQEMRFWWPVNVAELAYLQLQVFESVENRVSDREKKKLVMGPIITITAEARVEDKIPNILVPALDYDLEENPKKLWDMTYALFETRIRTGRKYDEDWQHVLVNLVPPRKIDTEGVLVPVQSLAYLAEIAENFRFHHTGTACDLAERLRCLAAVNRQHHQLMSEKVPTQQEHDTWRNQVIPTLNQIKDIVNSVFDSHIPALQ